jgi:DNA primase
LQDLEFRQFIERVKLRSPIETIVGERVSALRQRGALYWACCPFHQEKTPSFAVDPRRGTWRCFGACGEGGDVLSFVERFDGLTFLESLQLLARLCGEELPERTLRGRSQGAEAALEARFELMQWAAEYYRGVWRSPEGAAARAYMQGRGLTPAVLDAFGVGFAPENGQALVAAAARDKKSLDWLGEAGLVRKNDSGRTYDFFRGRVLIPIRDRLGRVVGFGGRVFGAHEHDGPKYVNTPETPLFHKGELVFGLDLAANAVRSTHQLLIVEGYTDVMAAHQAGWRNAVAVLGTATTDHHAALIRRSGAREVVLAFDGDEAGRKASQRALLGLLKLPVALRVAVLAEGRDPGDLLIDAAGQTEFKAAVEGAREWFDWALAGLDGLRGRELADAVDERFQLLLRLERPLERSARVLDLARHLGLPEADVRAQWERFIAAQRPAKPATPAPSAPRPAAPTATRRAAPAERSVERAYAGLIGALLVDNSLVPLYGPLVDGCPEGELALVFRMLLELYEKDDSGEPITASRVLSALGPHPARARVVALESAALTAESAEVLAHDQAAWLEKRARERDLAELSRALADPSDLATLARLHQELRVGRVPVHKPASATPHT